MLEPNSVHCLDYLELLRALDDGSVDAFITDLPYGTLTASLSWDVIIPFDVMWAEVKRVLKPKGVFVTTASQPFTSALVMSNPTWFRAEWIWRKPQGTGYLNANRQPMKNHENILVFADGQPTYNPQMRDGQAYRATSGAVGGFVRDKTVGGYLTVNTGERYPLTVLDCDSDTGWHPTQKPQKLYEYLCLTYSNPNDLIVDFCAGSGTTALAARNTNRRYIVGDISPEYVAVTEKRLSEPYTPMMFEDKPTEPMPAQTNFLEGE